MKILISYFYQIRFFKPYMIPLSTAVYDPKWYHNFKGHEYVFKDKNGVYNGLRVEQLMPGDSCHSLCKGASSCNDSPGMCDFLKMYHKQLEQINFLEFMSYLNEVSDQVQGYEKFSEEPVIVLLVHETPNNPCSERVVLQQWFESNGYKLNEFDKNNFQQVDKLTVVNRL